MYINYVGTGMGSATIPDDATLKRMLIYIPSRQTITGVKYSLSTAGISVYDSVNGFPLYSISETTLPKLLNLHMI